jgi:hypothetical protein
MIPARAIHQAAIKTAIPWVEDGCNKPVSS